MGAVKKIKKVIRPRRNQEQQQVQQPICICPTPPTPTENFQAELSNHIPKNG